MTTDDDFIREFMMKNSEWRGYTVKAIEDLDKEQDTLRTDVKVLQKELTKIFIKLAGLSATIGIITSIIMHLMFKT